MIKITGGIWIFMKITNKIVSILISISILFSAYSIEVNAANTSQTFWCSGNDYCRAKEDSSGVFVSNTSSYSTYFSIYGEDSESGKDFYSLYTLPTTIYQNVYIGNYICIPGFTERVIRPNIPNYNYYPYLHIVFYSGNAYGLWSPDSVGTYPYL